MPSSIASLLESRTFGLVGRIILTSMLWMSGIAKLADHNAGLAEMRQFGLEPAAAFLVATIICQLLGSALVIYGGALGWLGAGALAIFTLLTIPIAHAFWTMEEPFRTIEFYVVMEHICIVGGLMLAAASGHRPRSEQV